jgi:hypothetical protein
MIQRRAATSLLMSGILLLSGVFVSGSLAQESPEVTPETIDLMVDFINTVFVVDNDSPLTGEPVELTLIVDVPANIEIVAWPEFPELWAPLVVRQINEREVHPGTDGSITYRQSLTAILWVSGKHETPETLIGYRFVDEEDVYYIPVNPALFHLPSALESRDLNVLTRKPDRPPRSFFYVPLWVGGLVIIVSFGLIWGWTQWLERRRVALAERLASISQKPRDVVLAEFARIKAANSPPEAVFVGVSDTLRVYVEQCLKIPALEMTTNELLAALQDDKIKDASLMLDDVRFAELERLLKQADLVKFADLDPTKRVAARMLKSAKQWILAIDPIEEYVLDASEEYVE